MLWEVTMFPKLLEIIMKYKSELLYLLFGVLTTVVNYAVYLPLYNWLGISAALSNSIAWACAVLFAFFTNKTAVFRSFDWSIRVLFSEFLKFVGCRLVSGILETGVIFLTADYLGLNGNVIKLATSIMVIIVNYFGSKWFAFRKK